MSVLVAAPTYSGHNFCRRRYFKAYEKMAEGVEVDLFLVDTTRDNGEYSEILSHDGARVERMEPRHDPSLTVDEAWHRHIMAESRGYDWIFSLETDVIVADNTLKEMIDLADESSAVLVRAGYALHGGGIACALGCSLMDARFYRRHWAPFPIRVENAVPRIAANLGQPMLDTYNLWQIDHLTDGGPVKKSKDPIAKLKTLGIY